MTPYAVIATGYVALLAAATVMELLGRAERTPWRPIGEALHAALVHPVPRWVVLLGWLWVGFHFLAR